MYKDLIKGKRVVLVGGGEFSYTAKDEDVMIRVDYHYARQGGRCDVYYGGCNSGVTPSMLPSPEQIRYAWLRGDGPTVPKFADLFTELHIPYGLLVPKNLPEHLIEYDLHKRLEKLGSSEPFMGVKALYHVLHFEPAAVHVMACDLYYKEKEQCPGMLAHNPIAHAKFLKQLSKEWPNLYFCEELKAGIRHWIG